MSAAIPALEISGTKGALPTCSPNLMPFHIAYSGSAPIATFFRPKKAPPPTFSGPSVSTTNTTESQEHTRALTSANGASESQQTLVASSSTSQNAAASTATLTEDVEMGVLEASESTNGESEHLVATFRGRTVRGSTVALPEGYIGLVLDAPDDTKGKAVASSVRLSEDMGKGKTRKALVGKRGTRRAARPAEDEDGEDGDDREHMPEDSSPLRSLKPTSTFSSFVLWNADRPVDTSRDEYLRAITEWTQLAAVIHSHED